MRGNYTAGVLDCFLDNGIYINDVVGVSAGTCNAINYVSRQKKRSLSINTKYLDHGRYVGVRNLLTKGSIFNFELLFSRVPDELDPFDYKTYNASGVNVISVVTACDSGKAEYMDISRLTRGKPEKIQASASLPLLAHPVEIDGRDYLDGGIADSIPIEWSMRNGADKNIVVLTQPIGYHKEVSSVVNLVKAGLKKYPNIGETLAHRHENYNSSLEICKREEAAGRAIVIAPTDSEGVSRLTKDRNKIVRLYNRGYSDAQAKLEQIREFIKE